jgi:hypothetical protein
MMTKENFGALQSIQNEKKAKLELHLSLTATSIQKGMSV